MTETENRHKRRRTAEKRSSASLKSVNRRLDGYLSSALPCDGPATCPGSSLPLARRLLEIGTRSPVTHYGRRGQCAAKCCKVLQSAGKAPQKRTSHTTAFNPPGKCPLSKQQDGRAASPHR
ncbi:hypothetical protein ILYODFUR_036491 [Ilyodon furcidens]|uniref:Uncharacterized protein n=1 Tax=Ilyodon furcidens TaxID=33524 RepID=A0ABV0TPU0_9TELE